VSAFLFFLADLEDDSEPEDDDELDDDEDEVDEAYLK